MKVHLAWGQSEGRNQKPWGRGGKETKEESVAGKGTNTEGCVSV